MSRLWFKNINIEELVRISSMRQIGPRTWQKLRQAYSDYKSALDGLASETKKIVFTDEQVESAIKLMDKHRINVITIDDNTYPSLLREIDDPPMWLYYRGDLSCLKRPALTVVGSRKISPYGDKMIEKLLGGTAAANLTIVSGLAYGVDKKAHEVSLDSGGRTAAVLAGGLDKIYPSSHTNLADQIVDMGGVIISEYPPLIKPERYTFPIRNRILAGLSPVTFVVEAKLPSGSLTTARSALDYNREVWSLPADITRDSAAGSNFLIKQGAYCVTSREDILDYYNLTESSNFDQVDNIGQSLLHLLESGARSIDELVASSGLSIEATLGKLTELEIAGFVYQQETNIYVKK